MQIPSVIFPILCKVAERYSCSPELWKELNGNELIDAFFDLSSELIGSDIDEDSIPLGYVLLAYVFYWESNCQFSGWHAIENRQDEMSKIISCYEKIGLDSEAKALKEAVMVWFSSNQNYDAVSEAYKSFENQYNEESIRFSYLENYFKDNAEDLFYEN